MTAPDGTAPRTVREILTASAQYLEQHGVAEPRVAAELLMARLLKCKRLEVSLQSGRELTEPLLEAMRRGIRRVSAGEPVQYVLGQVAFLDHVFKVDKRALIPRPETEELVAWVLATPEIWEQNGTARKPVVADVGTGSGCIILSLAAARPAGYYVGLDTSGEALSLAQENATALGLSDTVPFLHGTLADGVDEGTLDVVVSNPPYIRSGDCDRLPVHIRDHEPRMALDGGADGLSVIREVVQDAAIALKPDGHLFMEIGFDQADAVTALLQGAGFVGIEVRKDLAGHDRMVHARSGV